MEHCPPVPYCLNPGEAVAAAVVAFSLFGRGFPDETLRWVWIATILAGLTAPINVYLARKASRRP